MSRVRAHPAAVGDKGFICKFPRTPGRPVIQSSFYSTALARTDLPHLLAAGAPLVSKAWTRPPTVDSSPTKPMHSTYYSHISIIRVYIFKVYSSSFLLTSSPVTMRLLFMEPFSRAVLRMSSSDIAFSIAKSLVIVRVWRNYNNFKNKRRVRYLKREIGNSLVAVFEKGKSGYKRWQR